MGDVLAGSGLYLGNMALECTNIDSVQIPACGCADIVGALNQDGRIILQLKTPQDFGWRPCSVVMGGIPVDPGLNGSCYQSKWVRALFDPTDGTPKAGDVWGPIKGTACKMRKYVPGGRVYRDQTSNDGPGVDVAQNTVMIMRYEPGLIWAQAESWAIEPGTTQKVNLAWYNPLFSSSVTPNAKLQPVPDVEFNVTEVSGTLSGYVPALGYLFCQWDEVSARYVLMGWVC